MSIIPVKYFEDFVDGVDVYIKKLKSKIHTADETLKHCYESTHNNKKKNAKERMELIKTIETLKKNIEILEKNKEINGGLVSKEYMASRYNAILDEQINEIDSFDYEAFQRDFDKMLNI